MQIRCIVAGAVSVATLIALSSLNLAQHRATTGDLRVTTRDQLGEILAGVDVMVSHDDNGLRRDAKTDARGIAEMPALSPGPYTIHAVMPQFLSETRRVQVPLGTILEISIILRVSGGSEYVTVSAEAGAADAQPASSSVIARRRIDALPTNGRNFISFALTTPGVNTDRMPQQGASATSGLSFAGQRARSNNITVDGLDNNDAALGAVRATFSQESVQEFQVLGAFYPAEFGKASGGVLNIVTRSGANRTAGDVFAFVRHHALNARDYFEKFDAAGSRIDRPKANFSQAQMGGTLGGAIRQDRAFYFGSFERLDVRANNFVNIDDSQRVMLGAASLGTPAQILENAGFAVETGSVPYRSRTDSVLVKTDYQLSPRQSLTARFNHSSVLNENSEAWGGLVGRSRGAALHSEDHAAAFSHVWLGSRALVNEFRTQYAGRRQNAMSLDPGCGGACVADDQGGPTIEVPGFAYLGRHRFTPQPRSSRRWQLLNTLSVHSGNHVFKTGFDASVIRNRDERLPLHFGGRYVFAGSLPGSVLNLPYQTVNAIQAVALGIPAAYVQGYGHPAASYWVADASFFVQDDWQMRRSLTLGMGVRYQRQYWPADFPADNNNFAPRLSVMWRPGGRDRVAVQSAYGLFFDNQLTMLPAVARVLDGNKGVRTLAVQFPSPLLTQAWNAPGRKLREIDAGPYPSVKFVVDPRLRTPLAHHFTGGFTGRLNSTLSASITAVAVHGQAQLGTIDYNPILQELGPARRPEDVNGVAGTSASVLQFTAFGRTWYRGLDLSLHARQDHFALLAAYTVSRTEDTSTDYQSAFIPQNNGRGRNPADREGLPLDFDPMAERGFSLQDQRHRLVLSGLYQTPWRVTVSGILNTGTGRPFSILAGADLNGDGNGGAFPADRARRVPSEESTAVPRNSARMPGNFTIDVRVSRAFGIGPGLRLQAMLDVFNVLNRMHYTDVNNIFGAGAYPDNPLPTYGQYTQAAPMRQAQLALKVSY